MNLGLCKMKKLVENDEIHAVRNKLWFHEMIVVVMDAFFGILSF